MKPKMIFWLELYWYGTKLLNHSYGMPRNKEVEIYNKRNEIGHWIGLEISGF